MAALGYRRVRLLYRMLRPLPLEADLVGATRSIRVRPLRVDDPGDIEGFLRVNNRAFHWHPEQGRWDSARLAERMAEPWFDPDGLLVHEADDGTIDGFCWTKVHGPGHTRPEDPAVGEIFVIAADPDTHGSGLGRALTVSGLQHLAATGLSLAMLYVEADNTAALSLYERLGFTVAGADAAYEQD
jgi:mycothiol synthase